MTNPGTLRQLSPRFHLGRTKHLFGYFPFDKNIHNFILDLDAYYDI